MMSSSYAKITPVGDLSTIPDDASANQLGHALAPYDAVLLLSFGGPGVTEAVMPFMENVTRGRGIPTERLAEVGRHYLLFGGRSPINDQCRRLLGGVRNEFGRRGLTRAAC